MAASSHAEAHGGATSEQPAGNGKDAKDYAFAMAEYKVPRHAPPALVKGGTMPKATPDSSFTEMSKGAERDPGLDPGYYFKDVHEKEFHKSARGGKFSQLSRAWGKDTQKTPAVGQYETVTALTSPKTKGGLMSGHDRVCSFVKMAEKRNLFNPNGPGKYDAYKVEKHTRSPVFSSPTTESRSPKKDSQIGPGYYKPNYTQTEFRHPTFTECKEDTGTYINKMEKDKCPFPWYKDMPESKVHDRSGAKKHCMKLLRDRKVPPRIFQTAAKRQALTPRQEAQRATTAPVMGPQSEL